MSRGGTSRKAVDVLKPSRIKRGARVLTAKEKDRSSQSQTMKILLVYSQDDPVDVALAVDGAEVPS